MALTPKQAAFAEAYVSGEKGICGNASGAAREAGYALDSAGREGYRQLQNPAVRAEIHRLAAQRMRDLTPLALSVLEEAITDRNHPMPLRAKVAIDLLARSGHVAPKAIEPETGERKPLSEMTMEELQKFISDGMERLKAEKTVIN